MLSGLFGFFIAILLLVSVHEYGHYIVARFWGVRVLRFSIGFGKILFSKQDASGTEFCLSAIPLGGYVKFLDTREIDSPARLKSLTDEEKATAFDLQNVWKRMTIVFAGPLINFILALVLFSIVSYGDKVIVLPVLGEISQQSTVYQAGIRQGDKILQINNEEVHSWNDVYMNFIERSLNDSDIQLGVQNSDGAYTNLTLPLDSKMSGENFSWSHYGLQPWQPKIKPIIAALRTDNGVINSALRVGDLILAVNSQPIQNWQQLVENLKIRANEKIFIKVLRDGVQEETEVQLGSRIVDGQVIGYLGVQVKLPAFKEQPGLTQRVNRGVFEALQEGFKQTFKVINLIVTSVGSMVVGNVGLDNIGGPITIAKQAGQSAQIGVSAFMIFLAFLSVSLGVLNLLPIPLLDGGHLVLYMWEAISGKSPSEQIQLVFQRIGLSIVIVLTVFAIVNDILRLQ